MTNANSSPTICVIGAGPCGLAIAKNLIQQNLTQFVVFEKNNQLGGNWVFEEDNNHSSVYETTHIISSKRLSSFEDFPMPDDYPDYPSHHQLLAYFNHYAEHFKLNPFIRLNTHVEKVTQIDQQWRVVFRDKKGVHEQLFDYLFVANGHHWDPLWPTYPGEFKGNLLHAHHYKKANGFKDQRVLVIGAGNSACDIAVEIGRVAKKVCISIRNGQHIFPKFIFGKPTDIAFAMVKGLPFWCRQYIAALMIRILQGRYAKYHLQAPPTKPLSTHPTINSELLYAIRHGKVLPRRGIQQLTAQGVEFLDGQREEFDTIIVATGYKISFPFFEKPMLDIEKHSALPLYLKMIHPELNHLFFIGLFQPQGCIWPLADYQAKIAAKLIAGTLQRPKNLVAKINQEIKTIQTCFTASPRHILEVDYHDFRKQLLQELD
jgi:hypothetical protein